MMDKEEKRIRVLELKHQELMTHIHTGSWIAFTIFVTILIWTFSFIREIMVANILIGGITMLALIIFCFVVFISWSNFFRKYSNSAKEIRDQIFKLEEEEMKEDKIKS